MAKIDYAKLYIDEPDYIKDTKVDADWAVWKTGKTINVRFEGSKTFLDWVMNFWFRRTKVEAYDGSSWKVHKGFKTAYYSVRNKVLDKCYDLYEKGDKFRVMGHSLGGAMALLAAEDIGWHFKQRVNLITWGAPRPIVESEGVKVLESYMDSKSVCFKNGSDLIPYLPWFYKVNPKTFHIGEIFNIFKAICQSKKYHSANYAKAELYGSLA